jgi:hypothetical protein
MLLPGGGIAGGGKMLLLPGGSMAGGGSMPMGGGPAAAANHNTNSRQDRVRINGRVGDWQRRCQLPLACFALPVTKRRRG